MEHFKKQSEGVEPSRSQKSHTKANSRGRKVKDYAKQKANTARGKRAERPPVGWDEKGVKGKLGKTNATVGKWEGPPPAKGVGQLPGES